MRGTYFSTTSVAREPAGVNPTTATKIYTTCVLPRAFFACELWNDITSSNMLLLERTSTHRLCLKSAQCLPKSTRSDMVTSLLGTYSIESYINEKKLLFLRTLCNMKSSDITNRIFVQRMFHFYTAVTEITTALLKTLMSFIKHMNFPIFSNVSINRTFPYKFTMETSGERTRKAKKGTPSGARAPHLMTSSASGLSTTARSQPSFGAWRSSVQTVFR